MKDWRLCIQLGLMLMLFPFGNAIAQNLLDMSTWKIGYGSVGIFTQNGLDAENIREWGEGPQGQRAILWKAVPDGASNADGGWNTFNIAIDQEKMYRFSIWLKKTNSNSGISYFGTRNVNDLDGNFLDNPYFWEGALPSLDKWYLLIGYVHGRDDPSTISMGGIYDGQTGAKVQGIRDFRFTNQSSHTEFRTYLYCDPVTQDRQYFYAPRLEEVNGNELPLASLMGLPAANTASGLSLFSGKVGINTTTPGSYDLAVNGKIRSREVRVDNDTWADYVFKEDYPLATLKEVSAFIRRYGYLRGMPSSEEVKKQGISLSEMNGKLLEKIEELTLYIIHQQEQLDKLQKQLPIIK